MSRHYSLRGNLQMHSYVIREFRDEVLTAAKQTGVLAHL